MKPLVAKYTDGHATVVLEEVYEGYRVRLFVDQQGLIMEETNAYLPTAVLAFTRYLRCELAAYGANSGQILQIENGTD